MLKRARYRLGSLLRRDQVESEMDEEMRIHMEMEIEERIRAGMRPEEARRTALRDFGAVDRFKEEARELRGLHWLEVARQDVRFAARGLRQNPGFAAVAIVTLALGIGANTAAFSMVNGILLRPLPFAEPDRIVTLWELNESGSEMSVTGASYHDWADLSRSFSALAIHSNPAYGSASTVLGADRPIRAFAVGATRDFFEVFGVAPQLGRTFSAEESREGGPAVAVVSHSFWTNELGGHPDVLGRVLDLWNDSYQVIGVMPEGFQYPGSTDIWVPQERLGISEGRQAHNYMAIGRLADGITLESAQQEVDRITAAMKEQHGGEMDAVAVRLSRLQDEISGDLRRPLVLLLGAASVVLLIACTNLASAFLARGAGRQREIAVRASLGASRLRLIRQLLTESLVLSALGTMAGLALAAVLLRALLRFGPESLQEAGGISMDGRVLAFALLMAVLTAFLFGLIPALRTSGSGLSQALRSASRGNAESGSRGAWGALVATEVALAVLLLIGSGLLIQSFARVLRVDTGFDASQVLTVELSLPSSRYDTDQSRAAFYQRLLEQLEALPGLQTAGLIQHLPLGGLSHSGFFEIEGRGTSSIPADYRVASGGYFQTMGIRLVRGRLFQESDRAETGDVAIVNRALADRVWPGEDPIGRQISNLANDSWIYGDRPITIVGVVENVRPYTLTGATPPEVYVHYLQRPNRAQSAVVTLRTDVPPASLVNPVRATIREIDPDVPAEFATMSARVIESVADRRFTMLVLGGFAALALLLSAVGIYGVVSYAVARRTREIGIRLALGAEPRRVRALMQWNAMGPVLAGAAAGLGGAILLTRVMQGLLYEVSPTDPATFAAVLLVLGAVAWLAGYVPARRTTRVDPMIAMRAE